MGSVLFEFSADPLLVESTYLNPILYYTNLQFDTYLFHDRLYYERKIIGRMDSYFMNFNYINYPLHN